MYKLREKWELPLFNTLALKSLYVPFFLFLQCLHFTTVCCNWENQYFTDLFFHIFINFSITSYLYQGVNSHFVKILC